MRSITFGLSLAIAALLVAPGCGVPQKKYDTTVAKLREATQKLAMADASAKRERARADKAAGQTNGLRAHMRSIQTRLAALNQETASLRKQLGACKASSAPPTPKSRMARMDDEEPTAKGALSAGAVRKGIKKIMKRVKRCYRKRGKKKSGKIVVSFRIKRGKPRGIKIKSDSIKIKKLAKCVRRAVRKARFAKSKKRTKVTYPFLFHSK